MRIGFIGARVVAQLISKPVRAVDHQGAVEQHPRSRLTGSTCEGTRIWSRSVNTAASCRTGHCRSDRTLAECATSASLHSRLQRARKLARLVRRYCGIQDIKKPGPRYKQSPSSSHRWELQTAKAQFSEVFRRARERAPQVVSRQDKEAVVIGLVLLPLPGSMRIARLAGFLGSRHKSTTSVRQFIGDWHFINR